ncbi:glycosyltransferase [Oculatella sp. LEGE 06141]|uniref:glycosyltransferase n=1 Tax=Oculatella sp. LEGE 06141 TaxID=1828648 RepID=UPI00188283A0|nr:glycosyltransferase [Oculatella sp. LEGE 06141]
MFRKLIHTEGLEDHQCLTILDPETFSERERRYRHGYYHPGLLSGYKYLLTDLEQFAQKHAHAFDVVIEKEWAYLGAFSNLFSRYCVPTVLLTMAEFEKKAEPQPVWKGNPIKKSLDWGTNQATPYLRKRWMHNASAVIAETKQNQALLASHGYLNPNADVRSVPNGINPTVFFPRSRAQCRNELGIAQDAIALVYVGSLNRYIQEPGPLIEALGREKPKNVVLHVVGDGSQRQQLEAIAKHTGATAIFHGRLPQAQVATYIGAADLCLAPYNTSLFADGNLTVSSLKVPEYLACARPVLTTACDRMNYMLGNGRYGYLIDNTIDAYRHFFRSCPSLNELRSKESALLTDLSNTTLREKQIVWTWRDAAQQYIEVIQGVLSGSSRLPVASESGRLLIQR